MNCTKAKALRQGLSKIWELPHESELVFTGNEWVLVLLDKLPKEMRDKLMFIWWRAWHHRNNIIFGDGKASIQNSINFLQSYLATLQKLKKGELVVDRKGKGKIDQKQIIDDKVQNAMQVQGKIWEKSPDGWIKCNVDASFLKEERNGAWGVVLRDHMGNILLSAWDVITHCQSAAMGEAIACLEGLRLGIANCTSNLIIETDCASVVESFREDSSDRSEVCFIAKEFNSLRPPDRQIVISKVSRNCNNVAHGLCQLSRNVLCRGVLQGAVPTCVSKAALDDCNLNNVF
jgi:ribonuclease HI